MPFCITAAGVSAEAQVQAEWEEPGLYLIFNGARYIGCDSVGTVWGHAHHPANPHILHLPESIGSQQLFHIPLGESELRFLPGNAHLEQAIDHPCILFRLLVYDSQKFQTVQPNRVRRVTIRSPIFSPGAV